MINKTEILIPETTYHLYNRANGNERLFLSEDNYRFFLQKYQEYISPIADTFCYCLMPNHFHFLVRIKPEADLENFFERKQNPQGFKNPGGLRESLRARSLENLISDQFGNFFNSYAKSFNKQHSRKGSLFMHPFKRKKVTDTVYLLKLVNYIHYNPIESKLCIHPGEWLYSSYKAILSEEAGFLKAQELISWFGNKDNFLHFHSQLPEQQLTER